MEQKCPAGENRPEFQMVEDPPGVSSFQVVLDKGQISWLKIGGEVSTAQLSLRIIKNALIPFSSLLIPASSPLYQGQAEIREQEQIPAEPGGISITHPNISSSGKTLGIRKSVLLLKNAFSPEVENHIPTSKLLNIGDEGQSLSLILFLLVQSHFLLPQDISDNGFIS